MKSSREKAKKNVTEQKFLMTEKEVLDLQQQSGNQKFYLILVGSFLHAYGNGAFALSRATGYRVMRKPRKQLGEILTTGFPISQLDSVRNKIYDAGGEIEKVDEKTWIFRGIDGKPDESVISEIINPTSGPFLRPSGSKRPFGSSAPKRGGELGLVDEIIGFNLSMSTPMDAMNFIAKLQQQLKQDIAEKVQGAD